ncbi:hypothetical protein K530_55110 [Streptomyces noursei CCRC 11814]|nr:hypothetical protein K530_55110 [Streptomyces noursei CCRC 11814]
MLSAAWTKSSTTLAAARLAHDEHHRWTLLGLRAAYEVGEHPGGQDRVGSVVGRAGIGGAG